MRAKAEQRRDGPFAAALLAGGLGILVLGLLVTLGESNETLSEWLTLYTPVGPLSGQTTWAVIAFAVSWVTLGIALRRKTSNLAKVFVVSAVLTFLGLLLTFPPVFQHA